MARPISITLDPTQAQRLSRLAARLDRPPDEIGAQLMEEALRTAEFHGIEFRDSPIGRLAYMRGSSLAVWEVAMVARAFAGDAERTAAHLEWPVAPVQDALAYARAYADDIDALVGDNAAETFESLQRILPRLQRVTIDIDAAPANDAIASA